jgi:hypothetical protein
VVGRIMARSDVGIGKLVSVLMGGPLIVFYRKLLMRRNEQKGV